MENKTDLQLWFYRDLVRRRIRQFALAFLVVLGAGGATVMMMPRVYVSEARILVEPPQVSSKLVESSIAANPEERIQLIQQRVMARDNVIKIADKLGLFAELESPTERVERFRRSARMSLAGAASGASWRPQSNGPLVFTVSFESWQPNTALEGARELVAVVIYEEAAARASRAVATSRFFEGELNRSEAELAAAEQRISLFKRQYGMLLSSTGAPDVAGELASLERERTAVQGRLDSVSQKLAMSRLYQKLEEEQSGERLEVLEAPIEPRVPTRPNRRGLLLAVLAAALGAGAAGVFALERLDNAVRRSADLRAIADGLAVAVLPPIPIGFGWSRRIAILGGTIIAFSVLMISGSAALHLSGHSPPHGAAEPE